MATAREVTVREVMVREVMVALARRYAFGDLQALGAEFTPGGTAGGTRGGIAGLCAFGQRVLDLDAEDFGRPEDAGEVPEALLARARASRMPQRPHERPRGALASLRPAYSLLLEAIAIRWERRDMAALTSAVHIAAEYLPLLAWEPVLGHAGDPVLLGPAVNGKDSLFGRAPAEGAARRCEHGSAVRAACDRALRVAAEPPHGWRSYLDRQHSLVADGLGVCGSRCRTPCSVVTRLPASTRADLVERCRLASAFSRGPLVRLRHAAPVGHGFGVPSPEEVEAAWASGRKALARTEAGRTALAGATGNDATLPDAAGNSAAQDRAAGGGAALPDAARGGYPLPGLPELFSAVAGTPIVPDTLLTDVVAAIVERLTGP